MAPARAHSVYVVRLDNAVLDESRFAKENPQHETDKPCVYVGMTGLDPDERPANHLQGHKSNSFVKRFGQYLMHRQFERLNPMTYEDAKAMEERLAEQLKKKGWAVWQRRFGLRIWFRN